MIFLDSSAVLCFLQNEAGADVVSSALTSSTAICAANWSEVAQRSIASGRNWSAVELLLSSRGLRVEPVTADDAATAARVWTRRPDLSLADRLCLAQAERLDATVLTCDRSWGQNDMIRQAR